MQEGHLFIGGISVYFRAPFGTTSAQQVRPSRALSNKSQDWQYSAASASLCQRRNVLIGTDDRSGMCVSFAGDLAISCFAFTHHHCAEFIEMPRPEIVSIDPDIKRQGERFIRKIAMRMSIEMPGSLSMVRPDPHGVVTKHDPLLRDMDLREKSPRCE